MPSCLGHYLISQVDQMWIGIAIPSVTCLLWSVLHKWRHYVNLCKAIIYTGAGLTLISDTNMAREKVFSLTNQKSECSQKGG